MLLPKRSVMSIDSDTCEKPTDSHSCSRPNFHRPFLDVDDSSPPQKLYKLCSVDVRNGVCAVPLHPGPSPTALRKTPVGSLKSAVNLSEVGSRCEADELDERKPSTSDCHELREDDGGRDKRLHAALGLISLADVSSDVTQAQLKTSTESADRDSCDG